MKHLKQHTGFSIIEVLVGILIFGLGLTGVFALVSSSLKLNDYNKNFIIASNLSREGIELVKNIRDTNYATLHNRNQINPYGNLTNTQSYYSNPVNFFSTGAFYTIENNFGNANEFEVKMQKILDFGEGVTHLNTKMQQYELCLDTEKKYTHTCSGNTKTNFFRYIRFEPVIYSSGGVDVQVKDALKVTSKVIWYFRGYNETDISTVIADWKRL